MKFYHYSSNPDLKVNDIVNKDQLVVAKPKGLWLGIEDDEYSWDEWAKDDYPSFFEGSPHKYHVEVAEKALLKIDNNEAFDAFVYQYGYHSSLLNPDPRAARKIMPSEPMRDLMMANILNPVHINWEAVAMEYEGIVIAPYLVERRGIDGFFYNSWDCACACIWSKEVILDIKPFAEAAMASTGGAESDGARAPESVSPFRDEGGAAGSATQLEEASTLF